MIDNTKTKEDQPATSGEDAQAAETAATTENNPLSDLRGSSLALQLNKFMDNPMNSDLERRFASMLLTASFQAVVQVAKAGQVGKDDVKSVLKMGLGITTYLADGRKYIPVFTDPSVLDSFMYQRMPNLHLRTFSFTTQELMSEVARLNVAGILVNPGKQSFPLTNEYWLYINHVMPLIEDDTEDLTIEPMTVDKMKLTRLLTKKAKHIRGVKALWATNVRLTKNDATSLAVIAQFKGRQATFDQKYSRELALTCQQVLDYGQDVLVGTTDDKTGAAIAAQCTPIYEATGLMGRRHADD